MLYEVITQYDFDIDNEFFEHFEQAEIRQAEVKVVIDLDRQQRMLIFNFDISGWLMLPCDRCLEEYEQLQHRR